MLAVERFEEARSLVPYTHVSNFIWATSVAMKANDCEKALLYYRKAVEQGFPFDEWGDSNLKECSAWTEAYEQKLVQALAKSRQLINQRLSSTIDSLYQEDQRIRLTKVDQEEFQRVDSLNFIKLRQEIERYGFPDERLVGEESAKNAFFVILHFDEDKGNKIMEPILKEALYSGKISPENYAWIVDRRLNWGEGKEPMYYHLPTKAFFDLTAEQKIEIDKRRYEIGLKPLSEMNVHISSEGVIMVEN